MPSARAEHALTREETETFSRPLCDEQNLLVPISVTRVKICPSRARETALFARDTSTEAIGCRVVVPPHSRKQKKSEKKRTRGVRRPTLPFDARAGEDTFTTRVLLRDVDAENIFVARVACARFLANSEGRTPKKGRKRDGEKKRDEWEKKNKKNKRQKKTGKKERQKKAPLESRDESVKKNKKNSSSRKHHHLYHHQRTLQKCAQSASFLPRFLPRKRRDGDGRGEGEYRPERQQAGGEQRRWRRERGDDRERE